MNNIHNHGIGIIAFSVAMFMLFGGWLSFLTVQNYNDNRTNKNLVEENKALVMQVSRIASDRSIDNSILAVQACVAARKNVEKINKTRELIAMLNDPRIVGNPGYDYFKSHPVERKRRVISLKILRKDLPTTEEC